ncbi:hypothetical protein MASR2M15_19140 [Anaerolineales bacterium]
MIEVRSASLDDTRLIVDLHCAQIPRWQLVNTQGRVEDREYSSLNLYERWLHGGAWMSVETGAIWLSHLLRRHYLPICVWDQDELVAYAELIKSDEPEPFGSHYQIAHSLIPENQPAILQSMIDYLSEYHPSKIPLLISCSSFDEDCAALYQGLGFEARQQIRHFNVKAQTGQAFYQAVEHTLHDPKQIKGWYMPIGRLQNSNYHWENLWPALWDAIPQIRAQKIHRLKFSSPGVEAFVAYHQHLHDTRSADVYCWSSKPLSSQLLIAIRDWAHRNQYRTLIMPVSKEGAAQLKTEAEESSYHLDIYVKYLNGD